MMPVLSREDLTALVVRHTANVCSTMLAVTVEPTDSAVSPVATPGSAVVALVGLTGAWSGSGVVSCSGPLACRLSGRMLMTEFPAVDAEVLDAMGEIANMIVGNVKEDLATTLGPLAISTPTVIHGDGLQTRSVEGGTGARLLFACEGGVLEVRVSLVPSARAV
jgi:chemotaxis protein CheX